MNNAEEPIIIEATFNSPIEKVWNAITVLEEMKQWYFDNIPAFKPVVDFETMFKVQLGIKTFTHIWKITEVIPDKKISYNWQFKEYEGISISHFELFKTATIDVTKLKLTAEIVKAFPTDIAEFERESGVQGWNYFINERLKNYLQHQ